MPGDTNQIPWSVILDKQRLRDLESLNIVGTGPEQSYDDLAKIARTICATPVANVSFVAKDKQWFKSYVGNDVQETPVEQSVCAHALDKNKILVINDLRYDDRTNKNALVTGDASLRFYAGVPLHLDCRLGVGTLCVVDTKPHPDGLTQVQIDALTALGRQATILLKVRQFVASQNGDMNLLTINNDIIDDISDALIRAYELNKIHKDKLIESLIGASLTHIAQGIASNDKKASHLIH